VTQLHYSGVDVALKESTYLFDNNSGKVKLLYPLPENSSLSVNYRAPGYSYGPFQVQKNMGINYAIPGIVLAFGNRLTEGDKQAVLIEKYHKTVGEEYGGKWEMSFGIDVIGRSLPEQEEIADMVVHYLWNVRKGAFDSIGLAILDIGMSGESTQIYDENTNEQDFLATIDITLLCSWSLIIPYTIETKDVKFSKEDIKISPTYKLLQSGSTIHQVVNLPKIVNKLNQFEHVF
jgi:hypothetical protein